MPIVAPAPNESCDAHLVDVPGLAAQWIAWYQANARDLPWRQTRDPYHVWLSEVMLQQTQVQTVLPYYQRFLAQFPTIQHLAQADRDQVMKLWEGLGYYARCRNLHQAAQVVADQYQGQFPFQFNDVHALPGIGRSTAGAILTFSGLGAYPILDGNVKRVFSRLLDIAQPVTKPSVEAQLWDFSQQLVDAATDPYSLNQGLMELGATLCTQAKPQCLLCPIQSHCQAFRNGTPHLRPVKVAKPPIPHKTIAVGVIWNDHAQVLVQRRPPQGLLGGLWEFPGGKQEPGEALQATVRREIHEELGIQVQVNDLITTVNHAYTHFKITLHAYHCRHLAGTPTPTVADAWQWIPLEALHHLSFPTANRKILEALQSYSFH